MPASAMFDIVNVSKLKLKVTANEKQVLVSVIQLPLQPAHFQMKVLGKLFSLPQDDEFDFTVEIEIANNADNNAGMYGSVLDLNKHTRT
jgi:hypothetical protein